MINLLLYSVGSGIRMAMPFLLAALGETVTERAGVRNLGLEGIIVVSAFFSFSVAYQTGSPWFALGAGVVTGALIGLLFSWAVVSLGGNQFIIGVMITILGAGLSSYLYKLLFVNSLIEGISGFGAWPIPVLSQMPILGPTLFSRNILVYIGLILVPLFIVLLFKTTVGLKIRAVGENARAAESVGIDTYRIRYLAIIIGSAMAGLAGSYLVLVDLKWFSHGMSAGRGWIALAIVIFGRWNPYRVFWSSMLFGWVYAFQFGLQAMKIAFIPYQIFLMLPYIVILFSLIVNRKELGKPAMLGVPFKKST